MKRILLMSVMLVLLASAKAQLTIDSVARQVSLVEKKVDAVAKSVSSYKADLDSAKKSITEKKPQAAEADAVCKGCPISPGEWILIFSPFWIFGLALIVVRKKLASFNLRKALTESELPKRTIVNPEYNSNTINALAANALTAGIISTLVPPTIEVTETADPPDSSSRYIALVTSVLTWIIILCLTSFFIYEFMKNGKAPDFTGLSTLLIALGIGIVPYAFNRISAAVK